MSVTAYEVPEWISEHRKDFTPPVCNKCMFADQIKLFFVGGPNQRKDYHMEEGEEFFYQRSGDMTLKVIEKGVHKDITIREGEFFLLPARVEHSPQRFANTIGFVVERDRENTEFDCIRYLVGQSTVTLWERWFHLKDVVKDLPPLIRQFFNSNEFKSGRPGNGTFRINAPYDPRWIDLPMPLNRKLFIYDHIGQLKNGPVRIYGPPEYNTEVMLLGDGEYDMESGEVEQLFWLQENTFATMQEDGLTFALRADTMVRVKPMSKVHLTIKTGFVITIRMLH